MSLVAAEPTRATEATDATDEAAALSGRLWRASLKVHTVLLAAVLAVVAAVLKLNAAFTTDEGAYAFQVAALRHGSWALHSPTDVIDPTGRWFGIVNGAVTTRGRFAYVGHPAYIET